MNFAKTVLISLLSFQFLFSVPFAKAAIPETELNQYLAEIGWTKQELQEYLDYYEIPIDEFSTTEELQWVLGTPINQDNFQDLLTQYALTEQELNALMNHFGDSLDDYMFIEDLDAAVDFYVNHDEYMGDIESELENMGITEEETEKFFQYLAEVEERNQHQLDQIELMDFQMEAFVGLEDTSELTDEQLDELTDIFTEAIELYEVQLKFNLNNKELSLKDLLKMKEAPEQDLFISIHSSAGELLIDFTVPSEFFETAEVIDEGEEILHLGEISNEFTDHLHEEKYKDLNSIEK